MRFSIEPGDRAYDPKAGRKVAKVTFDGLAVQCVLTADDELGEVRSMQVDLDGRPVVVDGEFKVVHRTAGRVVIELRRDDRAWDEARRVETKVMVGRHEDGTVEVLVYSAVRPSACSRVLLPPSKQQDQGPGLCQQAGVAAGAIAESMCARFRDTLDPDDCARVAVEQCGRMLAEEASAA